jgi:hypothetical protein
MVNVRESRVQCCVFDTTLILSCLDYLRAYQLHPHFLDLILYIIIILFNRILHSDQK